MKENRRLLTAIKKAKAIGHPPCALCGQPIDYDAPANEYESYELDHIIPKSVRPDLVHDPGNLQPVHMICNRRKNNKTTKLGLGYVSRAW